MSVKVREKVSGSGSWWVIIHANGRKVTRKVGTKAAAEKAAQIVAGRLAAGKGALPERKKTLPTLKEFFETFQRVYLQTAVRSTTRKMYEHGFTKYVLPNLGSKRLDAITRQDVAELVAILVNTKVGTKRKQDDTEIRTLSKTTISMVMRQLTTVFNHALEDELIVKNPTKGSAKLYSQVPVRCGEIQPLTEQEVVLFLQKAQEHYADDYPVLLCALHTGMRLGELAGLQWGDIDWNSKFITVRRQIVEGKVVPFTKTKKVRRIDMSTVLLTTLKELKGKRREEWMKKGQSSIPEWVFCKAPGNPLDKSNLRGRVFYKTLEKAGLRHIRFHDLRHTFATLLIQNGESLAYVQRQLGHASIQMTVDVYTHWMPGANREAMDKLPSLEEPLEDKRLAR